MNPSIEVIKTFPLVYLATPYSKYPNGIEEAFQDAAALTGVLLRCGVRAYSPIAHTHPIAIYGDLDPLDHSIWLPFDEAMMTAAHALVVAKMDGWKESYGVRHEIDFFERNGKPVFYLDLTTWQVTNVAPEQVPA